MNNFVAAVCAAVLVIALHSDKCCSLETSSNVIEIQSDERLSKLSQEDYVKFLPTWNTVNNEKYLLHKTDKSSNRVVRQAYQSQTSLYPNLPSGPPYGQQPYYNNQNIQPGYNNPSGPYGQNPQPNGWNPNGQPNNNTPSPYGNNNYMQPGYPNSNGYQPSNFTNNPQGTYGQYPQQPRPHSWPSNGQQTNYNFPFGTNTQSGQNTNTHSRYPISNGYKPSNFSYNPSGPYGQSTPPNSWQNPYSSSNGQPPYNSNVSQPYPGFKPYNTNNNPSGRPPYQQPGQSYNNSYAGYPSYTSTPRPYPGYPSYTSTPRTYPGYPSQRPPYYPSQSQNNNNMRPGNQYPVIYDDSTKRPSPYGNTLNNTQGRLPYNPQNGQSPQYFNSYPGSPGYGQQNSTNPYQPHQRPSYQDPHYGQNSPNNYPGQSSDSATFNLANFGYNPSIPNRPPYGSPYGNGPYGNNNNSPNNFQYPNHDPTKVSF